MDTNKYAITKVELEALREKVLGEEKSQFLLESQKRIL